MNFSTLNLNSKNTGFALDLKIQMGKNFASKNKCLEGSEKTGKVTKNGYFLL